MDQTRTRVSELGKILTKESYVKRTRQVTISDGYDGSEEGTETILGYKFAHSWGERRRALKELKDIRKTTSDEFIRRECQDHAVNYRHNSSLTYRTYKFACDHPITTTATFTIASMILVNPVYSLIKKLVE